MGKIGVMNDIIVFSESHAVAQSEINLKKPGDIDFKKPFRFYYQKIRRETGTLH